MHMHTHTCTHYINIIFSYLTTNWFSLHRIPALQDGKCSGNKASGKPNCCAVWSHSMLHLSFSSDKLYWMINNLFPFSSGAHHYRSNKHEKATSDSYIPPQKRGCSKVSYKCLYSTLHRLDDKQGELKSIGYHKAGNLPGITEKLWDRAHSWGMVTDGYNWSQKEGDGEGKE